MKNIIVFGASDDFEKYHRRPMLKSLSELMAEQNITIHYCNPPKFLSNFFAKKNRDRYCGKINIFSVFTFLPISISSRLAALSYLFVYLPMAIQLRFRGILNKDTLLWIYYPHQYLYIKYFRMPFVYEPYDNYIASKDYFFVRHNNYSQVDEECIANSKFSIFCGKKLMERYSAKNLYYFPSAVHEELILQAKCAEKRMKKETIIGYVGSLNEFLDENLIGKVADAFPDASVICLGPVASEGMRTLSSKHINVRFPGSVPYEDIGNYINEFDVGIVPYKVNDYNKYRNPLKVYEYAAFGVPAVTIGCVLDDEQLCLAYDSKSSEEFIDNIKLAMNLGDSEREALKSFARDNTWSVRAKFIQDLLVIEQDQKQE
jgi:hypothetical protein